ncbi:hypothetical protein BDN72DRAFT_957171 [Pluteus cervinus]|uniref:Uncharacterized protein n=1 Tax=Pluteus cervinus TaxID=181527 RepID=A0ACD3B4C6_9AGAR|nr:hypothetical protein BDN72DRAFT_957171 [Pluteus cervinus]
MEPHFPPEIELEIFLVAYHTSSSADKLTFLQVSKRVSAWLVPLLYRVVSIKDSASRYPPVQSLEKYGTHVRYIFIRPSGIQMQDPLLSHCPYVRDLSFWFTLGTINPKIFDLPLSRLSIQYLGRFEHQLKPIIQDVDQDTPRVRQWRLRITHLSMGSFDPDMGQLLSLFPNLTHLLFGAWNHPRIVQEALKLCPRLEVMVWLLGSYRSRTETLVEEDPQLAPHFDDIRVVTISGYLALDWLRGTEGLDDMWVIAERKIQERRALRSPGRI